MMCDNCKEELVYIQSNSNGKYWKAPHCGTTPVKDEAHKYTRADAEKLVKEYKAEVTYIPVETEFQSLMRARGDRHKMFSDPDHIARIAALTDILNHLDKRLQELERKHD